ncbi:MAG: HEPN domain-containing protein [Planctomycetota bacterium]
MQRERVAAFLLLAEEAERAANLLVQAGPRQAAYFLQQCSEMLARAVLTAAGVAFGPGHNLGQMAEALPRGHAWRDKLLPLDRHSAAATRFRYPSPTGRLFDPPSAQRLRDDLQQLHALLAEAKKQFGRPA